MALFIAFWCFESNDSVTHLFPFLLNWNCVACYFHPLWLVDKMKGQISKFEFFLMLSEIRNLKFCPLASCLAFGVLFSISVLRPQI